MQAEYFAPREAVILQNEAPADMYIVVSGALVSIFLSLDFSNLDADLNWIDYY